MLDIDNDCSYPSSLFSLFSAYGFSQVIVRLDAFLIGINLSFNNSSGSEYFLTMPLFYWKIFP